MVAMPLPATGYFAGMFSQGCGLANCHVVFENIKMAG